MNKFDKYFTAFFISCAKCNSGSDMIEVEVIKNQNTQVRITCTHCGTSEVMKVK